MAAGAVAMAVAAMALLTHLVRRIQSGLSPKSADRPYGYTHMTLSSHRPYTLNPNLRPAPETLPDRTYTHNLRSPLHT